VSGIADSTRGEVRQRERELVFNLLKVPLQGLFGALTNGLWGRDFCNLRVNLVKRVDRGCSKLAPELLLVDNKGRPPFLQALPFGKRGFSVLR
jgi:hypothetical protein